MATARKPAAPATPRPTSPRAAKPAAKATARPPAKPAKAAQAEGPTPPKPAASAPKAASKASDTRTAKAPKAEKPRKPKLVRDSFTIPKAEYAVIEDLKARAGKLGAPSKKSELLRAGVKALAAMGDAAFLAALNAVPAIKTGRPAKD